MLISRSHNIPRVFSPNGTNVLMEEIAKATDEDRTRLFPSDGSLECTVFGPDDLIGISSDALGPSEHITIAATLAQFGASIPRRPRRIRPFYCADFTHRLLLPIRIPGPRPLGYPPICHRVSCGSNPTSFQNARGR